MSRNSTFLPHTACWISIFWMMTFLHPSTGPWSETGRRGTRSGCSGGTPASRTPGTGGSAGCWILSYVNHLICIDIDNIYTQWVGDPPGSINLLCYVHWTWEIIYLSIRLSAWIIVTGIWVVVMRTLHRGLGENNYSAIKSGSDLTIIISIIESYKWSR